MSSICSEMHAFLYSGYLNQSSSIIIDTNYIYNKIINKRDINQQISLLLQKALWPFHHLLEEYTPQEYDSDNNNTIFEGLCVINSKLYYTKLSSQLKSHYILSTWNSILYISPKEYQCIFKLKLANISYIKIKEFNSKVFTLYTVLRI